jgi:hypothetical protein
MVLPVGEKTDLHYISTPRVSNESCCSSDKMPSGRVPPSHGWLERNINRGLIMCLMRRPRTSLSQAGLTEPCLRRVQTAKGQSRSRRLKANTERTEKARDPKARKPTDSEDVKLSTGPTRRRRGWERQNKPPDNQIQGWTMSGDTKEENCR